MRRADKVDLPHDVNVTDVDSAPIMTAEETVERLAGNASQDVTPDAELRERFARIRDAQGRGGNGALSGAGHDPGAGMHCGAGLHPSAGGRGNGR